LHYDIRPSSPRYRVTAMIMPCAREWGFRQASAQARGFRRFDTDRCGANDRVAGAHVQVLAMD